MKKILLLLTAATTLYSCSKKVTDATKVDTFELRSNEKLSDETLNAFKKTTTILFYKEADKPYLDSLENAVKLVWTITPIQFENIRDLNKFSKNPNYSCLIPTSLTTFRDKGMGVVKTRTPSCVYDYFALRYIKSKDKKGKIKTDIIGRIELFPRFGVLSQQMRNSTSNEQNIRNQMIAFQDMYYNYSPTLLAAQLMGLQDDLNNHIATGVKEETTTKQLSTSLQQDTLYIPRSVFISFSPITTNESQKDENDVMSGYPYPYKVCENDELYDIFVNQKRGRYLLQYVKTCNVKIITLFDMKEDKVAYKEITKLSYNFKAKDLKKLTKQK